MNKLTFLILKLAAAAAAAAVCICAVVICWDRIISYCEAGWKLYCHERKIRGHRFRDPEYADYADLDWENTEM